MSTWTCVSRIHGSCGQLHETLSAAARCCQQFEVTNAIAGNRVNRLPYENVGGTWQPIDLAKWRRAVAEMHEGARVLTPARRAPFRQEPAPYESSYPQLPAPRPLGLPAPSQHLLSSAS